MEALIVVGIIWVVCIVGILCLFAGGDDYGSDESIY